jgi:protein ImuB
MTRVASLYLPHLAIERLRRLEQPRALPEPQRRPQLPVDDDPGACSVPRGGGWRPGARWARDDAAARALIEEQAASLPLHQQPTMRELGRRSEAAEHPFKRGLPAAGAHPAVMVPIQHAAPMILAEQIGQRQIISAACPAALALGLKPGMAVTQARALVPELDIRPADNEADQAVLDGLTLHAVRHWTPIAAPSGADGIWLDLSGATHLHGGEDRFCQRLIGFCRRFGFNARVAVAGTPGAAHALARFSRDAVTAIPAGSEAQALAGLPLAALRLTPEALTAAARFGLDRIVDLLPLPRGPLARRLGLASVRRLDEALGRVPEPIVPVVPEETPVALRRLLEPISTADAIEQVIRDLLDDMIARLQESGAGARTLILTLERVDGSEQRIAIGTSRPTRDASHLARLFHLRIDRIDLGEGVESMRLAATRTDPLGATALSASLAGEDVADVTTLVDQLAGRVGDAALFTAAPVESDVPERAVRRASPLDAPTGWPAWRRPVRLLNRPEPLTNVIALLPDQPPRRFTWRGQLHAVVAGDGPERIHGEWWRRDGEVRAVRDYFRVEDDAGARFWLFRRGDGVDPQTGDLSWYLHGLFG